jgi:hypothetical protein
MPLRSSLAGEPQLVDVYQKNTSLVRGAIGLGVLAVKRTLFEMGYRIDWNSGGGIFATFDLDLEDALKKFAAMQASAAGAAGVIDRTFLDALDNVMLGQDFNVPDYAPSGPAGGGGPVTPASIATALIPDILIKLIKATTVVDAAQIAFKKRWNDGAYRQLAPAFDLNFGFDKMKTDHEMTAGFAKITNTFIKAQTYMWGSVIHNNIRYAPPALVRQHFAAVPGQGGGAAAYYRPADKNLYCTDKLTQLGPGGRWRATTHELMHAAGIDHGTFATRPPYWWNLDAYHALTPTQRLNNADNYVWFVIYCLDPFGRKQPTP